MGKKKNKKKKNNYSYQPESIFSQTKNNEIADHLEAYIEAVDDLFVLDGKDVDEVDKAMKIVKKAIKNLREGKPEKVFDMDRYEEFMDSEE